MAHRRPTFPSKSGISNIPTLTHVTHNKPKHPSRTQPRPDDLVVARSFTLAFPLALENSGRILFVKISAVIIAFNEEAKIADAVRSVGWADEVIVVDSESTDATREIAESLGARVIVRAWPGFSAQKQFGVDEAANDWVFSLDADERATDELRDEIVALGETDIAGYTIPRLSYYMGRPIRHGNWYPDRQLRLFDRRKAKWKDVVIHESVEVNAGETVGKLNSDILHFTFEGIRQHADMIANRYAPLSAEEMHATGRRASIPAIVVAGPAAFLATYIFKLGFLDGLPGFVIAVFAAYNAFLKYLLLREMLSRPE